MINTIGERHPAVSKLTLFLSLLSKNHREIGCVNPEPIIL
jgi:hypothetical protein